MKVLIAGGGTGGHLMPALAIADALRTARSDVEVVLVGAERGIEAELLPGQDVPYHLLPFEPVHRRAWWRNARWPLLVPRLLRAGAGVLDAEQPDIAVGTGGYASGPILYQAARRGIPVVLQEQNAYPGMATRRLSRRAREIYLGFPEAEAYLKLGATTRVHVCGNPIRPPPDPRPDRKESRKKLGLPTEGPVLLVYGGSQGARSVNRAVARAVADGHFDDVALVWSVGSKQWAEFGDLDAPPNRIVRPFLDPIADAYSAADLAVARGGAMSTAELLAWGLPAILIPLPTSAAGHQTANAEALAAGGAAVHLPDAELGSDRLVEEVSALLGDPERLRSMGAAAMSRGHPNAAQNIAAHIVGVVS
jgi:UDP-N-acetylglucosamine--N-acetylmuramyl-(pentapeptide) pyrophosphoryl-undecaprenol N-acetylglucosamine transferase